MDRVLQWVFSCFLLFLSSQALCVGQDAPLSASEALKRACRSIDSVQALHYTVRRTFPPGREPSSDSPLEYDAEGRAIRSVEEVWWDARRLLRMNVHELLYDNVRNPGNSGFVPHYDDFVVTHDGTEYRGYGSMSGYAQFRYESDPPSHGIGIPEFLGYGAFGQRDHLARKLLVSPDLEEHIHVGDDGVVTVRGTITPENVARRIVEMDLAPEYGYLPVRIHSRYEWSGTDDFIMAVLRFDLVDGVFIPTAATYETYFIRVNYPDGLTVADANRMSKEEYQKIADRIHNEAVSLSPRETIEFDPGQVSVNDIKPVSFFHLEVPADATVLDFRDTNEVRLPSTRPTASEESASPSEIELPARVKSDRPGILVPVIVLTAALIGTFLLFQILRRTIQRRRNSP